MGLKIFMYDKIKQMFMPFETNKYKGFDYFWRCAISASMCMGITTLLTYPFDLVHTRMTTDISKKGQTRLYSTTFECFNRTNLDEGRKGLYKGVEFAVFQGFLRGVLTLPVYDSIKSYMPQSDSN